MAKAVILTQNGEAIYPQTTPSQVVDPTTGKSVAELMNLKIDASLFKVVNELPSTDIDTSKIYLIQTATHGVYSQWIYNGTSWSNSFGTVTLNDLLEWLDVGEEINLADNASWTSGGCISGRDGTIISSQRFSYTDYIPVEHGKTLNFSVILSVTSTDAGIYFYNSNYSGVSGFFKNGISPSDGYRETLESIEVPSSAAYVRLTKYTDDTVGEYQALIIKSEPGRLTLLENEVSSIRNTVPDTIDPPSLLTRKIIATISTYMVGYYDGENSTQYLIYSKDLGRTWTTIENIYGNLTMCHIFSNGSVLLANSSKVYKTEDFLTFAEVIVTDVDGSTFVPDGENYFEYKNGDSWTFVNGVEMFVWGEYKLTNDNYARIFYTTDMGTTVKCAFEFDLSKIGGVTIPARHVHQVIYDKYDACWWIITGDDGNENNIIKGLYNVNTDSWSFERIAYGPYFKFGEVKILEHELILSTDYTNASQIADRGLLVCNKNKLNNIDNYRYLYNLPASWLTGNVALTHHITDTNGNQLIMPDYRGYGMFFWSKNGQDFRKITISDSTFLLAGVIAGPNYNNDLYCACRTSSESPISHMMKSWINLTEYIRNNGASDFMRESIYPK